ncbi:MAG: bifunctional riboflavin kinase/FAD synthetase [Paludibacteraceae bacterium]|nr:bifunctional riboflavin kinase/FAD synthetase [Paludibacteraceae bacterium]
MAQIATIGFFDGVHKGHQFLFEHLRSLAKKEGLSSLCITFSQHPRTVLQSDYLPQLLSATDDRIHILQQEADEVLVLDFEQIASLTAHEFMVFIHEQYQVDALLMGYDHHFGCDNLRTPREYKKIADQIGITLYTLNEYQEGEWHVSSTEIRRELENGNIVMANDLLGRPYTLAGKVVHGNGIGHKIGFPTANIAPAEVHQVIPANGVYSGEVLLADGTQHKAIINIGTNPTVGNSERTIEVHIPKLKTDLYGSLLTIIFSRRIRDEHKFDSLEELQEQIKLDIRTLLS